MKYTHLVPGAVVVAISGGPDSSAAAHFFSKCRRLEKLIHISYEGDPEHWFDTVNELAAQLSSPIEVYKVSGQPSSNKEEFWRNQRYSILRKQPLPIITAHNLDDNVETWLMSVLKDPIKPKLIPWVSNNIYRPFQLTSKKQMLDYCQRYKLPYIQDPDNKNNRFLRSYIRNQLLPEIYTNVNPGLHKKIKRMLIDKLHRHHSSLHGSSGSTTGSRFNQNTNN